VSSEEAGTRQLLLASGSRAETRGSCLEVVEHGEGCSGVVLLPSPEGVLPVPWCFRPGTAVSFCREMSAASQCEVRARALQSLPAGTPATSYDLSRSAGLSPALATQPCPERRWGWARGPSGDQSKSKKQTG